jgi:hypothetical protein
MLSVEAVLATCSILELARDGLAVGQRNVILYRRDGMQNVVVIVRGLDLVQLSTCKRMSASLCNPQR